MFIVGYMVLVMMVDMLGRVVISCLVLLCNLDEFYLLVVEYMWVRSMRVTVLENELGMVRCYVIFAYFTQPVYYALHF